MKKRPAPDDYEDHFATSILPTNTHCHERHRQLQMLDSWLERGNNPSITNSLGLIKTINERNSERKKPRNLTLENSNRSLII